MQIDCQPGDGWSGFNENPLPSGWVMEAGTLKAFCTTDGNTGRDIVYAKLEFDNFELVWDWKISSVGKSGDFTHVVEDGKHAAPYHTGPEF